MIEMTPSRIIRIIVELISGAVLGIPLAIIGSFIALYFMNPSNDSLNDGVGIAGAAVLLFGIIAGGLPGYIIGVGIGVIVGGKLMKTTGKAWAVIVGELGGIAAAAGTIFVIVYITDHIYNLFNSRGFVDEFFSRLILGIALMPLIGAVGLYEYTAKEPLQHLKRSSRLNDGIEQ